jgi:hypothetical protein
MLHILLYLAGFFKIYAKCIIQEEQRKRGIPPARRTATLQDLAVLLTDLTPLPVIRKMCPLAPPKNTHFLPAHFLVTCC